jgi:transposase
MPRSRPYPAEFRQEAVRLWRSVEKERSLREVASELGISMESLRGWVKRSDIDEGKAEGPTTDEREELARLRRENRVLREEREILKKAAAFFARETDSTR